MGHDCWWIENNAKMYYPERCRNQSIKYANHGDKIFRAEKLFWWIKEEKKTMADVTEAPAPAPCTPLQRSNVEKTKKKTLIFMHSAHGILKILPFAVSSSGFFWFFDFFGCWKRNRDFNFFFFLYLRSFPLAYTFGIMMKRICLSNIQRNFIGSYHHRIIIFRQRWFEIVEARRETKRERTQHQKWLFNIEIVNVVE